MVDNSNNRNMHFDDLVIKYQKPLQKVAYNVIFCEEEAKDIVQDSFFSYFTNYDKFRQESTVFTYLYRIVLNKSIDYLRKFKKNKAKTVEINENIEFKDNISNLDIEIVVKEALKKLDIKYRLALILLEYENKSYDEIAEILNVSPNNVKIIIFRAREKLFKILEKMGVTNV